MTVNLVPTITVVLWDETAGGVNTRTADFYCCTGATDNAGVLSITEIEAQRGLDGEIVGFKTKAQGRKYLFAPGQWVSLTSEWIEEAQQSKEEMN